MEKHERSMQGAAAAAADRLLAFYDSIAVRVSKSRKAQLILAAVVLLFVLIPSVILLILPFFTDFSEERLQGLGYAGIFVANLAGTATVFIPVPGVTAAGQALIITGANDLNPIGAGILGGLGMALGEITAYGAGAVGREFARGRQVGGPTWFRRLALSAIGAVGWLMARYGMLTLFVLAAVPNPLFEFAGLTAGSVRMKFWRFMAAVLSGKVLRGLLLAFFGASIGL
jgi:membrane protein DedA with SNARE-associated domain